MEDEMQMLRSLWKFATPFLSPIFAFDPWTETLTAKLERGFFKISGRKRSFFVRF